MFPLGRLSVSEEAGQITSIAPLQSPWEIEAPPPPLRILTLEPDCDPFHAEPQRMLVTFGKYKWRLDILPHRGLLVNLRALLERYDPDLLLTAWGDTWLLLHLLEFARETGLPLPLNRDPDAPIGHKKERSHFSYGRVVYRGQQALLSGRLHVDGNNAVMFHEYGLDGVFELARVTALSVQTVARVSPGTGISSMQIVTALKHGVLVPYRKQQAESPRSALDLLRSDLGGLVYQPLVGLHRDVVELDFVSMYPSIMAHFNISPEAVIAGQRDPGTGLPSTRSTPGLVPITLAPLLEKRIALKTNLLTMPSWDPRRKPYKAWAAAHKALLVTCFGYLGYRNARFGRIEAHEAVTAYGRECLLRAKEAAEEMGYTVLHVYVDAVLIQKPGVKSIEEVQPLLEEILERTGLPIALDGIFRWVAFLPSTQDSRVSVANRYFGVFQSGEVKARGIDLRRHDTCPFIKTTQEKMLEILAQASSTDALPGKLRDVRRYVHRRLVALRSGRIPLEQLVVRQTLSRELELYKAPSRGRSQPPSYVMWANRFGRVRRCSCSTCAERSRPGVGPAGMDRPAHDRHPRIPEASPARHGDDRRAFQGFGNKF